MLDVERQYNNKLGFESKTENLRNEVNKLNQEQATLRIGLLSLPLVGWLQHKLNDDTIILTNIIIWSAGVAPNLLTSNLTCDHDDKTRKIIVDKYLEVSKYRGVYALGDCVRVMDPNTGNPPPTEQHAIREGSTKNHCIYRGKIR